MLDMRTIQFPAIIDNYYDEIEDEKEKQACLMRHITFDCIGLARGNGRNNY